MRTSGRYKEAERSGVRALEITGSRPDAASQGALLLRGAWMSRSPGASEADPIFEVTGVAANEILRRCAALRAGLEPDGLTLREVSPVEGNAERTTWRLVDFADVSDADFVQTAHVVLLGRLPGDAEAKRRTADLHAGCSRFEIVVRLALSPEGRRLRDRKVSGIALPAIVAAGCGIERTASTRVFGAVVRRMEQAVRQAFRAGHGRTRAPRRLVPAGLLAGATVALVCRTGQFRRSSTSRSAK